MFRAEEEKHREKEQKLIIEEAQELQKEYVKRQLALKIRKKFQELGIKSFLKDHKQKLNNQNSSPM